MEFAVEAQVIKFLLKVQWDKIEFEELTLKFYCYGTHFKKR
jgi:hypothetical protein